MESKSPDFDVPKSGPTGMLREDFGVQTTILFEVYVIVQEIKKRVEANRENIISFMRAICAIPSMDGQLKEVGERIGAEMTRLGFEEVRFDKMGNILGRIGSGPSSSLRTIVYDSHIDTVGIGYASSL